MKENNNHIKEISELFKIPKSTLRYWDSEGLIHFDRESSNDYRRFSLKTIMEISDVAFYRSMNISIEDLKSLQQRNVDELEDIIKKSGRKIEEQMLALKEMMKKIETRMKRINQYRQFLEQPYSLGTPNFQMVVKTNFMDQEHTEKYLSDPYIAAIFLPIGDKHKFEFGYVEDGEFKGQNILWHMADSPSRFIHCLLKVAADYQDVNCFEEHRYYFDEHGYQMGNVVGRYLFTAYDQKLYDYYDGWIEIAD